MIIVIMFLATVLLGVITWATYWKFETEIICCISLLLTVISGIITTFMLISCIFVHIPFCKNQRLIEYEQKYITITQAINTDVSNIIILADQIAEYNSDILKGRMMQDSKYFNVLNYDFYYDLPLIELNGVNSDAE